MYPQNSKHKKDFFLCQTNCQETENEFLCYDHKNPNQVLFRLEKNPHIIDHDIDQNKSNFTTNCSIPQMINTCWDINKDNPQSIRCNLTISNHHKDSKIFCNEIFKNKSETEYVNCAFHDLFKTIFFEKLNSTYYPFLVFFLINIVVIIIFLLTLRFYRKQKRNKSEDSKKLMAANIVNGAIEMQEFE